MILKHTKCGHCLYCIVYFYIVHYHDSQILNCPTLKFMTYFQDYGIQITKYLQLPHIIRVVWNSKLHSAYTLFYLTLSWHSNSNSPLTLPFIIMVIKLTQCLHFFTLHYHGTQIYTALKLSLPYIFIFFKFPRWLHSLWLTLSSHLTQIHTVLVHSLS